MSKVVVVTPTVRPECLESFKSKWSKYFQFHNIDFLVIYDGEEQRLELNGKDLGLLKHNIHSQDLDLVPKFTDSCRVGAFLYAAEYIDFDYLLTFDDDVSPIEGQDAIKDHINILGKFVSNSWLNTTHGLDADYMRGFPYAARAESEVNCSVGTWRVVPDLDGITQHFRIPRKISNPHEYANPNFYIGPIPKGVYFPFCGMSVAVTRKALPELYYAPMGKEYHRFGDIFLGINLAREFWKKNWSIYTGASQIIHERASNVYKNITAEVPGLEMNEIYYKTLDDSLLPPYFSEYTSKRLRFKNRITELLQSNPRPTPNTKS